MQWSLWNFTSSVVYFAHLGYNFEHTLSAHIKQKNWWLEVGDVGTETMKKEAEMKLLFVYSCLLIFLKIVFTKSLFILILS